MTSLFKAIVLIPFHDPRWNFRFEPQKKDMNFFFKINFYSMKMYFRSASRAHLLMAISQMWSPYIRRIDSAKKKKIKVSIPQSPPRYEAPKFSTFELLALKMPNLWQNHVLLRSRNQTIAWNSCVITKPLTPISNFSLYLRLPVKWTYLNIYTWIVNFYSM